GMRERTVQISSAGKTFSCTGWKVGWACGPAALVSAVLRVKQFLTFVNAGPLQPAVAVALGLPDGYFTEFRAELQDKRDRLCEGLADAGFGVLRPQGTYFVTADITPLGGTDGVEFCRALPDRRDRRGAARGCGGGLLRGEDQAEQPVRRARRGGRGDQGPPAAAAGRAVARRDRCAARGGPLRRGQRAATAGRRRAGGTRPGGVLTCERPPDASWRSSAQWLSARRTASGS